MVVELKFQFARDTKSYRLFEQQGGINKLYLSKDVQGDFIKVNHHQ